MKKTINISDKVEQDLRERMTKVKEGIKELGVKQWLAPYLKVFPDQDNRTDINRLRHVWGGRVVDTYATKRFEKFLTSLQKKEQAA